jgi:hypothetical protein
VSELEGTSVVVRIRSGARNVGQPRTNVGRWLMAGLLNQPTERKRLALKLFNGDDGSWNYDEPAVVIIVAERAIPRLFPAPVDVREITSFVMKMRSMIHSTEPPDQLKTEALIRYGLGDRNVDISGIKPREMFDILGVVLVSIVHRLGITQEEIRKMVLDGENTAFDQGWKPSLAE